MEGQWSLDEFRLVGKRGTKIDVGVLELEGGLTGKCFVFCGRA